MSTGRQILDVRSRRDAWSAMQVLFRNWMLVRRRVSTMPERVWRRESRASDATGLEPNMCGCNRQLLVRPHLRPGRAVELAAQRLWLPRTRCRHSDLNAIGKLRFARSVTAASEKI